MFVILVYKLQIDSKQVSRYAICFCTFADVERIHTYILSQTLLDKLFVKRTKKIGKERLIVLKMLSRVVAVQKGIIRISYLHLQICKYRRNTYIHSNINSSE